jgi:hypothetical protein
MCFAYIDAARGGGLRVRLRSFLVREMARKAANRHSDNMLLAPGNAKERHTRVSTW